MTTLRYATRRILLGQLFALTVAALLLVAQWASAAVYEETCTRRPMLQGMVGEHVTTCELVRVPSRISASTPRVASGARSKATRHGRTTVTHYGKRAPLRYALR